MSARPSPGNKRAISKSSQPLISTILSLFVLLLMALLDCKAVWGAEPERQLTWGTSVIVLKSPWEGSPSLEDVLADHEHTIVLDRFYRTGGENRPVTATECHITYNQDTLFVVFRCKERDMAFPVSDKTYPDTNRATSWYSMQGSPGASDSWPPLPDEVDFFVQPDLANPTCYQFATTPDGLKLGCSRVLKDAAQADQGVRSGDVGAFEVSVSKGADEWTAFFKIPWKTVGGTAKSSFGFLPLRTRWRDGEYSSPAAIDFNELLPVDLFIKAEPAGSPEPAPCQASLCELPSGMLHWQIPAVLTYPDAETLKQVWQLESSLSTPTDTNNLGQRLYLTQRWTDLLLLEGWIFRPRVSEALTNDLTLKYFRQKMNAAFEKNDIPSACQLLDTYLGQVDKISRWWFADESPGDIRDEEWTPVASVDSLAMKDNTLLMRCEAGGRNIDLHLALPKTGGIRIYGRDEGFFKPADWLPIKASRSSKSWTLQTADGKVAVNLKPFSIDFYNATGKVVTQIGVNDLRFRFGADGKVLAVDFKNQLDSNEVIYGFGERYDVFNENGNVFTLWGSDDWLGNGQGLRNTTYKLVPIYHSSKGYSVFDNSTYRLRGDFRKADPAKYRLTQQGPILDYYFWIETPQQALRSYTALTGRVPLPPKWVFEPWMGRGGGAWAHGPLGNAVAEEENTFNQFAALDIPHSAIYAEGPSASSPELNKFMGAHGIKVLGYYMPAVRRPESLMPEMKPEELPVLRFPNGNTAPGPRDMYVDFTNPKAKELVRRALKRELDAGVAGSMVDFGDMVPDDAVFHDGRRGDEMHNFYSFEYHKAISELYREKRGDDFILYGRAGSPGTQHWLGQFAGDHPSDFDGLKAVLTGALNLCACGFSTWGSDLGGYFGLPEPAVYMRWIEFGCFSPIWRPHGKATRDPWYFGDAAVASYKYDAWVRENILNYTYNAAVVASETGVPIMRSMPLSFPGELPVAAVRDEYMFGGDMLVAPVINEDNFRIIAFPSGVWTSLWDGKTVTGPADVKTDVPLDVIPVYLKPGAVVPAQLNRELQFGRSMSGGRVSVMIVTPPGENETVSPVNEEGKAAKVTVQSKVNGITWKLENRPETAYLLVYGVSDAATVKVDGKVLPKLASSGFDATSAGWQADQAGNRLVICMASDTGRSKTAARTIELNLSAGKN
ncbi:MAG TPA: TIM-barrel domain-containing protein [Verrucomicrobiae bacterium]|nr:TIM-barrel domain-containing protein [Verrucomicrobiae bacterium]